MGSKGIRDEPCGLAPFPEVPIRIRSTLMRYGFTNQEQVKNTPDVEIRLSTRLSAGTVAIIRRYYPFSGEYHEDMICPCCGGRGRVKRFEARANKRYVPAVRRHKTPEEQMNAELQRLERREREGEGGDDQGKL